MCGVARCEQLFVDLKLALVQLVLVGSGEQVFLAHLIGQLIDGVEKVADSALEDRKCGFIGFPPLPNLKTRMILENVQRVLRLQQSEIVNNVRRDRHTRGNKCIPHHFTLPDLLVFHMSGNSPE